ncbi:MAG: excinuclease ABC subunit UvrA [Chlamydiia bacterium]|nr:excinuclease ABC subunit UvrA [Chlamydiia bacterium]
MSNSNTLSLYGVRVHNLKSVDVSLPARKLIVFTGVSGSGKSSLAFDTLFAEGQRRYVESLSLFARRQMGEKARPDFAHAEGMTPTLSIEQKSAGHNPRSTVGTMTQIYDYLRVLFARVAVPHCPISGDALTPQSPERIATDLSLKPRTRILLLAPLVRNKKSLFRDELQDLRKRGYRRVRIDGRVYTDEEWDSLALDESVTHDLDLVVDRLIVDPDRQLNLKESLEQALELGDGACIVVDVDSDEERYYSIHAHSPHSGISYPPLTPQDFSFNSPVGMCPKCQGLGTLYDFDLSRLIDGDKSILEDCCTFAPSASTVRFGNIYHNLQKLYEVAIDRPWKELSDEERQIFLYGDGRRSTKMQFVHPDTRARWTEYVCWRGVIHDIQRRYSEASSKTYRAKMEEFMEEQVCSECKGGRIRAYPAAAQLGGLTLPQVTDLTIDRCLDYLRTLRLSEIDQKIASELLKELIERLQFLEGVGLHYLCLSRRAPSLSGGEAQRVRLASQIGSGLSEVTYVLDEPSIGLHPRDNTKLIEAMRELRDRGNRVVVVEHDEEMIRKADYVVDFGPGAGSEGGEILFQGECSELLKQKHSETAAYLKGTRLVVPARERRQPGDNRLILRGARLNNLKGEEIQLPLGVFVAVAGVSGSGKSSLILDTLYPALKAALGGENAKSSQVAVELEGVDKIDKVIAIDQSPIGRNPRSTPATYIKLFDEIRKLFSELPESRARGFAPGRFSFNVKEGSCPRCRGMGMVEVDLDFLEPIWIECEQCQGWRFEQETLSVRYKGATIADVLEMNVSEAKKHFEAYPSIEAKLSLLEAVGMNYIKLGQSSTTLSGGEAQRIKLAKELVRPAKERTLFLFDEPTTGLHFSDVSKLLEVLHALVDKGHTVVTIEHHTDVLRSADWIIEMGPDGGSAGGYCVATGPVESFKGLKTPTAVALYPPKERKKRSSPTLCESQGLEEGIRIVGAGQHNLKGVDAWIPRGQLTVCAGPSGAGKSSFAFDTVYAEGQRRYTDSLSTYARQFVQQMPKPIVEEIKGLSPAIAIEQVIHASNPRSTVGTMTEVYEYLRVLFARLGIPHCPETGEVIQAISKDHVVDYLLNLKGEKLLIMAPVPFRHVDEFEALCVRWKQQGFLRIDLDGQEFRLDEEISLDKKKKYALSLIVDRLKIDETSKMRLFESVSTAAEVGEGKLIARTAAGDRFFNLTFSAPSTGKAYPEITPQTFSFNAQEGMCLSCRGLGMEPEIDWRGDDRVKNLTLETFLKKAPSNLLAADSRRYLLRVAEEMGGDLRKPLMDQPLAVGEWICKGGSFDPTDPDAEWRWEGLNALAQRELEAGKRGRQYLAPLLRDAVCKSCSGSRLNPLALNVTLEGRNIAALCREPIDALRRFLQGMEIPPEEQKLLDEVQRQLMARLEFLSSVGLGYLSLERKASTLSGGEAQRIRLARQLGSALTGVLYVLDEPTIGLHQEDRSRLFDAFDQLLSLGNTLLVVEHDLDIIRRAHHVLDFGPGAGIQGGEIVARGTPKSLEENANSLTGAYLSGRKAISPPAKRRAPGKQFLTIQEANLHNLKNLTVKIPVGCFVALTGVSGSGKSTLMQDLLYPAMQRAAGIKGEIVVEGARISGIDHFDDVIMIDQSPIGRTIRADVASYVDCLTPLRTFFAELKEAKVRGLQPKHFSYNHLSGMCRRCWGLGFRRIDLQFLPPIEITCEECQGNRLNPRSLEVLFRGRHMGYYLNLSVEEMIREFDDYPRIVNPLKTLVKVGLGYLKLNQAIVTLSGGEAQRVKISRELSKRTKGTTLYLLDEPSIGLHREEIAKVLNVLQGLVNKGNTLVLIEHHLDLILASDHVIELGPGAGEAGGKLLFEGSPDELRGSKATPTGRALSKLL